MTTMIVEIYEAFIAAGTPEAKAKEAAQAIANYERRFSQIRADLAVLKWMTGVTLAGVGALFADRFF